MKNKVLHIELRQSEADIICWMHSLEKRTFNHFVNEILSAESKGRLARLSCEFSSTNEVNLLSCQIVIRDKAALDYVAKIPKGEIKTTLIKVIRKHIAKNRELPTPIFYFDGEALLNAVNNFVNQIRIMDECYSNMYDKHRILKLCEMKAYDSFVDEIWKCYRNVDEIKGNQNLRDLNIEKIIKEAFMSVPEFEEYCNLRISAIVEYGIPDEEIEAILRKLKGGEQ